MNKRRVDAEPADEPAVASEPIADTEPVVEGEAVELPADPPPLEPALAGSDATPVSPPEPVARPVEPELPHVQPTTPLSAVSDAGAPIADGHGPDPLDGHGHAHRADPLLDPLKELAAERPEYVVGAAFAGGILAAMILRRLGN